MRFFIVFTFLAAPLFSQTKPSATQLRTQQDQKTYVLLFQNGKALLAQLGDGLILDMSTTPPKISAASVAETVNKLVRNTDGTWQMPTVCRSPRVFRNGLLQLENEDFTVTATSLKFRNGLNDSTDPSLSDDLVVVICK